MERMPVRKFAEVVKDWGDERSPTGEPYPKEEIVYHPTQFFRVGEVEVAYFVCEYRCVGADGIGVHKRSVAVDGVVLRRYEEGGLEFIDTGTVTDEYKGTVKEFVNTLNETLDVAPARKVKRL